MTRSLGRRMGWAALALAAAVSLAPPARAQSAPDGVRGRCAPVSVAAGASVPVPVVLEVSPGWHVNANPPVPDYLIPVVVDVKGAAGLAPRGTDYPAGRQVKLGFDDNPLSLYDGTVTVTVTLAATRDARDGTHTLRGTVRYQPCNDEVCLAPTTLPFAVEVTVTGGAAADPRLRAGAPAGSATAADTAPAALDSAAAPAVAAGPGGEDGAPASAEEGRLAGALARGGLWWFVALFLGGLALNLTPCVFPMIGITVSVFGARKRERTGRTLAHAVAYVLGIVITYSLLGAVAAATGSLFGAALQSPWVNVGLGLLFVALSLSMFGLYEMQPPAWVLQRLGGADATSLLGIFLSGLAVGIIAAPCVGPFVVAVLALLGQRGDALFGFQSMFAMSLGLGLPYLFLAVFSNLIQNLPRSGDWMLWVKKLFGILLVAIGLYYVLIGLAPRWAPWVLPAALLVGGLYLGFVDRHGSAKPAFRWMKRAAGALAILAAVPVVFALRAEGIRFAPYDEAAVQAALAAGRPVMLDFSAAWCLPCHEMERTTFTDRRVIERSRDFAVFQADLTRSDSPEVKALLERFDVAGPPAVLFFTRAGEVRAARVVGYLGAEPFLERMEIAAAAR